VPSSVPLKIRSNTYLYASWHASVSTITPIPEDPSVDSSDYPLTIKLFAYKQLLILHSCVTVLSQKLFRDNSVALRFSPVVLCPLLFCNISFTALCFLLLLTFLLLTSLLAILLLHVCLCHEGVPANVVAVFLLPAARGSFMAPHHLLSLLAANQLPLPLTKQLQFSVAASRCRTTS